MKRPPPAVIALIGVAVALLVVVLLLPKFQSTRMLSGYVEGETLYLASPVAGTVAEVAIRRGDRVGGAGKPLFVIKPDQQAAQNAQAAAELAAALAQAEDVRKGQRPAELGVFAAEQAAAEARAREAKATLNRITPLAARASFHALNSIMLEPLMTIRPPKSGPPPNG